MRIRIPNTGKKSFFKIKWFRDPDIYIICVVDQDPVPGPDPVISLLKIARILRSTVARKHRDSKEKLDAVL